VAESVHPYAKEVWIVHHDILCGGKDLTDFLTFTGQTFTPGLLHTDPRVTITKQERPSPRPVRIFAQTGDLPSLGAVMAHYGIPVSKTNEMVRCPFHPDGTASMSVSLEKEMFKCFGCDAKGTAYKFVMLKENCDLKKAKAIIKKI
jgi:hypothetical protein